MGDAEGRWCLALGYRWRAASGPEVKEVQDEYKKLTFARTAMLPALMLFCYLGLWFYFRSLGGYKPVEIGGGAH